jgi:WD40 repeat protein
MTEVDEFGEFEKPIDEESGIFAFAVLPDGRLASGADDGFVRLWDPATGEERARLEGHRGCVRALAALTDSRLVSYSDYSELIIWDPASGAELARLEGHSDTVRALAMLPDGRLASGSDDNTIRHWDPASGAELARLKGHGSWVSALAVLPDGRLASGSHDDTIRLWDPASGAELARLEGHEREVVALAVLPDGRLASLSADETICLWDTESGAELARLEGQSLFREFVGGTYAISPDGRVASGMVDNDGTGAVRIWDLESHFHRCDGRPDRSGSERGQTGGAEESLVAARDGVWIGRLEIHTRWARASRHTREARLEDDGDHTAVAFFPSGDPAVAIASRSVIKVWDPGDPENDDEPRCLGVMCGHSDDVYALAVLPGARLASGSDDGTIVLWDLETFVEIATLEGHDDAVKALVVLPNGRIVSGARDNTVRLWDPESGSELARIDVDAAVTALAVLPDGRIAAGDALRRIHWLNIEDAIDDVNERSAPRTSKARSAPRTSHEGRPTVSNTLVVDGQMTQGVASREYIALHEVFGTGVERLNLGAPVSDRLALPLSSGRWQISINVTAGVSNVSFSANLAKDLPDVKLLGGSHNGNMSPHFSPATITALIDDVVVSSDEPLGLIVTFESVGPSAIAVLGQRSVSVIAWKKAKPIAPGAAARVFFPLVLALLSGIAVAAILIGPSLGFPQAREVWDAGWKAVRALWR